MLQAGILAPLLVKYWPYLLAGLMGLACYKLANKPPQPPPASGKKKTSQTSTTTSRKESCDDDEDEGIQDDDDIAPALEEELEHVPYKFAPISAVYYISWITYF